MEIMRNRLLHWDSPGSRHAIALTDEEQAFVDAVDLRMWPPGDEHYETCQANKSPILALVLSLIRRGGIPEERWKYWSDPAYRVDRSIKDSPKGVFEKNGKPDEDPYVHPHFIPYLRYFLFGVYLPGPVIEEFDEKVGNPAWVTSGDIVPLGKLARDLTGRYSLYRNGAALEFFKLCLDIGLGPDVARSVRRSVMQSRSGGSRW